MKSDHGNEISFTHSTEALAPCVITALTHFRDSSTSTNARLAKSFSYLRLCSALEQDIGLMYVICPLHTHSFIGGVRIQ